MIQFTLTHKFPDGSTKGVDFELPENLRDMHWAEQDKLLLGVMKHAIGLFWDERDRLAREKSHNVG